MMQIKSNCNNVIFYGVCLPQLSSLPAAHAVVAGGCYWPIQQWRHFHYVCYVPYVACVALDGNPALDTIIVLSFGESLGDNIDCVVVLLRMSWKQDVLWLHECILAPRSTSPILSGSRCCRLQVLRYRSWNCWMISTLRSTTPYHATTSTRSVSCDTLSTV